MPHDISGRLVVALLLLFVSFAFAAETYPPPPEHYFNDYAHVVSPTTAAQLDQKLTQFERDTSNQIVVAVFPKFDSNSELADYSQNLFQAWKIGQKAKNNGVGLFVFIQDRKVFIKSGYGLEGALPDATCFQIIENDIKPRFKAGDYDGGLTAGVDSILAATKGEYKGTGTTAGDGRGGNSGNVPIGLVFAIIVAIIVLRSIFGGYTSYGNRGRSRGYWGGGFGGLGGGFGGGGFGGGGGGGFSGGGGSSGGGGAGGSW